METSFALDPQVITILVGTVIPILVGLVTKSDATSSFKSIANALLSAIGGTLIAVGEAGGVVVLSEIITSIGLTWVTSVATYYGLLKPTGAAQGVQDKTASFGLIGRRESSSEPSEDNGLSFSAKD